MRIESLLHSQQEHNAPQIESSVKGLTSSRLVYLTQIGLTAVAVTIAALLMSPVWLMFFLLTVAILTATTWVDYKPHLVYFAIIVTAISTFKNGSDAISPIVLVQVSVLVVLLRSHALMQFARKGYGVEGAVILLELRRLAVIVSCVWAVGALAIMIGGVGNSAVSLVIAVVPLAAIAAAFVLQLMIQYVTQEQ